jgi:hypothetical protein
MKGSIKRSGSADEQGTSQSPVLEIDRPPSTGWMRFSLVPGFPKSDPRSLLLRLPEGSSGNYSVTLILGTPGKAVFNDLLQLGTLASTGDSLLEIGKGIEIDFTLTSGEVEALVTAVANSSGQMASLRFRVNAQNFDDAIRFSYDLIAPSLSWWSYWYDVPLDVKGYEAIEESTGARQYLVGVLGCAKGFDPRMGFCKFDEEFRSVLAIYREATNATNFFYKVLSFYKVTEGVRILTSERRTKAFGWGETWR